MKKLMPTAEAARTATEDKLMVKESHKEGFLLGATKADGLIYFCISKADKIISEVVVIFTSSKAFLLHRCLSALSAVS